VDEEEGVGRPGDWRGASTDELRGRGGRGEEVVEDDERAEADAYPPREVRLVEARDPCARREHGLERRAIRQRRAEKEEEEGRAGRYRG
jgi:hypothetical protein